MSLGPTDAELARLIAGGGPATAQAEAALVGRYGPRVRLYGIKHLSSASEADDLAQQVMLRVLEAIRENRVEDRDSLASFVFGTCKHISWDMRRREQRQRNIARECAGSPSEVTPPIHSERDFHQLFRCIQKLPEREALVLRMTYMEDRDAPEVGSRLGLSAGNVRVIRCRALAKMARCMNQEEAR